MPSLETLVTVGIVAAGVLALLHILSTARAGVVLAHQLRYEEATHPVKPDDGAQDTDKRPSAEPISVG